tara:strand:- start:3065 stop:3907 length:843 start_codon:yes stop_codon:yes gene_type:complete
MQNLDITDFEAAYVKTFAELNRGRDFQLRQNTRKGFTINDLKPKNKQKIFFWEKLSGITKNYVKIVYDASTLNQGDLLFGLYNSIPKTSPFSVSADAQNSSMNKIYICDLKVTKTMIVPQNSTEYSILMNFILTLIDTNLFDGSYINKHKSIKVPIHFNNSQVFQNIKTTMIESSTLLGKFAAVLLWILHTANMNKFTSSQYVSRFDPLATVCNLNTSTRLFKVRPQKKVIKIPAPETMSSDEEKAEKAEKVEKQENTQKINEAREIPDSWEDLEDNSAW